MLDGVADGRLGKAQFLRRSNRCFAAHDGPKQLDLTKIHIPTLNAGNREYLDSKLYASVREAQWVL
jgi:hypothetical protein